MLDLSPVQPVQVPIEALAAASLAASTDGFGVNVLTEAYV